MTFLQYSPGPPLSAFVEVFWFSNGHVPSHAKERLLPTGTLELVINLREDQVRVYDGEETSRCQTLRGAVVCGPHSGFFVIDTAEQESVVGIHFRPGGAFPFLHLTAGELLDAHVSLETLWGTGAATLRDRLLEAPTPDLMFRILEQTLLDMADRPLVRHPAVSFALDQFQRGPFQRSVSDLVVRSGLCHRRFIRVFTEEVGLTPKLFARIQRFQQVLQLIETGAKVNWSNLAATCGYYDQAHFIRDFRIFSGINPTEYLAQRTPHRNHVPLIT
jgi:AraC-like DNA-binding protein